MANSDYAINGTGQFAATASLANGLTLHATSIYYQAFVSNGLTPATGDMIMVGDEIMRIDTYSSSKIIVGRGCADTVPQSHNAGATIWFLKQAVGTDKVAYSDGEQIGIKPLPRGASKPPMAISAVPPKGLTFVRRLLRPYAPGNVEVDGNPFGATHTWVQEDKADIELTWAHRNRVTQADQLIDHTEGSVTPEAGTTYTVEIVEDGVVVRTAAGISGTSFDYTPVMWLADGTPLEFVIRLKTVRDGIDSYQNYEITVDASANEPVGLGYRLGEFLGGVFP